MVTRFTFKSSLDIFQGFSRQSFFHLCSIFPIFLALQAVVNVFYTHHLFPAFIARVLLCDVSPFSPRDLSYPASLTDAVTKFLGTPFAPPEPFVGPVLSRLLQAVIFHLILRPSSECSPFGSLLSVYLCWIPAGLMRTLISFVFTRSLGWAYPSLFRHWAMYETSEGFGAGLVVWFYLRMFFGEGEASEANINTGTLKGAVYVLLHLHETSPFHETLIPMGLRFILISTIFEGKPWTYACALLSAGLLWLILVLIPSTKEQDRLPPQASRPPVTISSFFLRTFLPAFRLTVITLLMIYLFYFVQPFLSLGTSTSYTPIPPPSNDQTNLLEIVVLSYPRPGNLTVAEEIIATTMESFYPLLTFNHRDTRNEGDIVLSVFTHAPDHLAFEYVKSRTLDKSVLFYLDEDDHSPDEYDIGQYLHLAEAFRWVASDPKSESRRGRRRPEWIMIVEDDFPLCGKGVDVLKRTLWLLEMDRKQSSEYQTGTKAAFIGTGGSGLIFHRTLLSTLEHVLRTHAITFRDGKSPFPPSPDLRPPDVVMQDCLLGSDPLCARYTKPIRTLRPYTESPRTPRKYTKPPLTPSTPEAVKEDLNNILRQSDPDVMMFIPSSLVMDHIGGMVSTTVGKRGNTDKWRCGWRHAFHGKRDVGVLVV
ncbi:hypothetical protein L218DRAFT_1078572 [Marasmius fiardii PR-910]|nr:hypothetical protein L218DRAFT_1078572 [Marasmius fiardii PR-910]